MNPFVAVPTFIATVAWVGVVVWYWIRAKWWKSFVGQNTMAVSFFIALSLVRLTYAHLDNIPSRPSSTGLTVFGVIVYAGLAYTGFQRVYLIEQSQRQKAESIRNGVPQRRRNDPK